jgi:hypothetical protein
MLNLVMMDWLYSLWMKIEHSWMNFINEWWTNLLWNSMILNYLSNLYICLMTYIKANCNISFMTHWTRMAIIKAKDQIRIATKYPWNVKQGDNATKNGLWMIIVTTQNLLVAWKLASNDQLLIREVLHHGHKWSV